MKRPLLLLPPVQLSLSGAGNAASRLAEAVRMNYVASRRARPLVCTSKDKVIGYFTVVDNAKPHGCPPGSVGRASSVVSAPAHRPRGAVVPLPSCPGRCLPVVSPTARDTRSLPAGTASGPQQCVPAAATFALRLAAVRGL